MEGESIDEDEDDIGALNGGEGKQGGEALTRGALRGGGHDGSGAGRSERGTDRLPTPG